MTLVKNWDFGANGTIPDIATMSTEFQYHDPFNQFNNGGGQYGANTVAPDAATALPGQPVEDPANPVRAFTANSLQTYLIPADPLIPDVTPAAHNVGCGSFVAQGVLPNGGALLGQSILWETRVRFDVPPYFWFAIWADGNIWNNGAEMDVVESFGFNNGSLFTNFQGEWWHSNSVGGNDNLGYGDWVATMASVGIKNYDATKYHIWQWLYNADDTYKVYNDGIEVQNGTIHWTAGGTQDGTPINMNFMFDGGWGHTLVRSVNHPLPAIALTGKYYEWDYSRLYLSQPVS
jgi:hypothetical protein